MDAINALLEAVTRYGFPVVMCFLVWRANEDQAQRFAELVQRVTEAMSSTATALDRVSAAILEIRAMLLGRDADDN